MKYSIIILGLIFLTGSLLFVSCQSAQSKKEAELINQQFKEFYADFEKRFLPLYKKSSLSYYQASITGTDEDFQKATDAELKLTQLYSNKEDFAKIERFKDSRKIKDPIDQRILNALYNLYVVKQVDDALNKQVVELQNDIIQKYNTYAVVVDGKKYSINEVEDILSSSTDLGLRQRVWEQSKAVGAVIDKDLVKLVKLRNQVAQQLGYKNFREMTLLTQDENPKDVDVLFDELDRLTRDSFANQKAEIDAYLSKWLKVPQDQLMPWHYQDRFFQEAPTIFDLDLDSYFKGRDILRLGRNFFEGLGLKVDEILTRSDLYEKPGKDPSAFANNMDYMGDIRVLLNMKDDYYWMNTLLHELGHAVYWEYHDPNLPVILKDAAQSFTTEGIAQMLQWQASNAQWLQDVLGISNEERDRVAQISPRILKLGELVFARWSQVMVRFEKALYENPDQDMNTLWWDLVEKYQLVKRPPNRNAPDWASKTHFSTAPCYYHNYQMGGVFAAQLMNTFNKDVLHVNTPVSLVSYHKKNEIGQFMRDRVFAPGAKWYWNDMIKKATGEKLTAKYYAEHIVK